jgi:hypothetical protein
MRVLRAIVAGSILVLLGAGCYRSDIAVSVNDDGSGTITAVFAMDPKAVGELGKSFGGTEELGDDPCAQLQDDAKSSGELPKDAKVESYKDGNYCGVKLTVPIAKGEDISQAVNDAFGGLDSTGIGGFSSFVIERDGNGWRFEAKPQADEAASDPATRNMAQQFLKGASNVVRIKLPGKQVEQNADRIDSDGTMVWNLDVLGESRTLHARTEPGDPIRNKTFTDAGKEVAGSIGGGGGGGGGGSSATAIIVVIVLVVLAAIGGFFLWKRTRNKPAPALAGMPDTAMPPAPIVPPPPGAAATPPLAPPAPGMTASPPAPGMTASPPAPGMTASPPSAAPPVEASAPAAGPQWDAQRNAYIQWDAASGRWMQYDNAAGVWKPIE